MQKRPTNQTKPTNWTPAPTYQHQGHQAVTQRKVVARGASRTIGSVEPALAPVKVHFGGKAVLILLKAVLSVSMYSFGGNRPIQAI